MEKKFDAMQYFSGIGKRNRLAKQNKFHVGFCSGIEGLQDALGGFQTHKNFFLVDDTTDGRLHSGGNGHFQKRVYTVFIIAGYRFSDMADRERALDMCREIARQVASKLLNDYYYEKYEGIEFLDINSIMTRELGRYSISGGTGMYFMVGNDEPINLVYNAAEWDEDDAGGAAQI